MGIEPGSLQAWQAIETDQWHILANNLSDYPGLRVSISTLNRFVRESFHPRTRNWWLLRQFLARIRVRSKDTIAPETIRDLSQDPIGLWWLIRTKRIEPGQIRAGIQMITGPQLAGYLLRAI